jgi:hypothetical protein
MHINRYAAGVGGDGLGWALAVSVKTGSSARVPVVCGTDSDGLAD